MQFKQEIEKTSFSIKFSFDEGGKEVGRVRIYIFQNNLHKEPFGLIEDLFVDESRRGEGIGKKLMQAAIAEGEKHGCYKLLLTCRHEKKELHKWYQKLGFKDHGVEFRKDL